MRTVTFSDLFTDMHNEEIFKDKFLKMRAIMNDHAIAFYDAIGYLSTWAISEKRYTNCHIAMDRDDGDLIIGYSDQNGNHTFTMGAIWDNDRKKYSFHS